MTRWTAAQWVEFAWVSVVLVFAAVVILQAERAGPVQTVERDLGPITVPSDPLPCTGDDTLKLAAVRNPAITCPGSGR